MKASKKFIQGRFPNCDIALLAGSASRGEETASSDLDILIFEATASPYRESFEEYGWRIECFVHNHESYLQQFQSDRVKGSPVLAAMIAEGKVLKDHGQVRSLKEAAETFIKQGPEPLKEPFVQASRYFIFDLLDDFMDAKEYEEAAMSLNTMSVQLIDFVLRVNGQWSGRGKTLVRALRKFDAELCERLVHAMNRFYRDQDKKAVFDLVHEIYRPLGGQLFAGFSMGKTAPHL